MQLTSEKIRLAIIGAGEMGLQAMHYASLTNNYDIIGFIDDTKCVADTVAGKPVLGGVAETVSLYEAGAFDAVFVAIGYKHLEFKKQLVATLSADRVPLATIVAPSVYIDPTASVGNNVMVYPGCVIDKNVRISDGVVLNIGCIVSHDTVVGQSCFLAPGTKVAGFSTIGQCCFLGIGTIVIDNVEICDNVTTGAGATVVGNIVAPGQYLGVPAVKIK